MALKQRGRPVESPGGRSQEVIICWGYIAGLSGLPFSALGRDSNWKPPDSRLQSPQFWDATGEAGTGLKCQAI